MTDSLIHCRGWRGWSGSGWALLDKPTRIERLTDAWL